MNFGREQSDIGRSSHGFLPMYRIPTQEIKLNFVEYMYLNLKVYLLRKEVLVFFRS